MIEQKKDHPAEKSRLHSRNKHRARYDFMELIETCPELTPFVRPNIYDDETIDFADPEAVKMLNQALLKHYYGVEHYDIPENYLCPPIPGRADYIHHIADVLSTSNYGSIPTGKKIKCLDIGVGANCIYPIIGHQEYGWSFVATDIDPVALDAAKNIVESNSFLQGQVEFRLQEEPTDIFYGIIQPEEQFDLSICNPPFYGSADEAREASLRKLSNLKGKPVSEVVRNFGGHNNELWCKGGESAFIAQMIRQSRRFSTSCFWYSTLVSKQSHLKAAYQALKTAGALEVKTIPMGQGNKSSRLLAWTFLPKEQQKNWINTRWRIEENS